MTQHAELLARYKQLRQIGLQLNNRLVNTLSRNILDEGGKRLGILKKNALVLDSEDEMAVLMDYCIHDVRRQGVNAIERYLVESPPSPDSDEMKLLQALRQARYSFFAVESVEPGVGVHVHDLLRDEPLFLIDVGFSQTACPGMILAARVMTPGGIGMTTGAALPVGMLASTERTRFLQSIKTIFKDRDFRRLPPEEASELAATVIRTCLQQGAAAHIRYIEPRLGRGNGRISAASTLERRVGRNEPCPCGSGRKFKHCCGSRR